MGEFDAAQTALFYAALRGVRDKAGVVVAAERIGEVVGLGSDVLRYNLLLRDHALC